MSELKCCPFCSGEPQIETYDCKYSVKEYWIYCCSCDCASSRYYSKETAIEKWNTRKPMDNIVEKLEEETDFLKDCTKYGNKDAKQQEKSYSTMMMYEVAGLVDYLIDIVKQEINNGLE